MKAEDIIETAEFSGVKQPDNSVQRIMMGYLFAKGKAKNNNWYPLCIYGSIYIPEKWNNELLQTKREEIKQLIFNKILQRTCIKGFRGRFQFTDFKEN